MMALMRSALGMGPLPWQGSWLILVVGYIAIAMLVLY